MTAEPEFDRFAGNYEEILDKHTRIGGEETGYFASYKVDAVRKRMATDGEGLRILDFGCGVGQSIPYFRAQFPRAEILGADVSPDSVAVAEARHGSSASFTRCAEGEPLPYADDSLDVVFTACVFHHIPSADHVGIMSDIRRVLRPGGRFFVFEHNPLNLLTVKIVNDCPFDENAVLIRASTLSSRLVQAGFSDVETRYCLFVPGWLRWLRPIETALTWCPAGAQYFVESHRG